MEKFPQSELYKAVKQSDHGLIDYAYEQLDEVSRLGYGFGYGSDEFFGGSVAGATVRYLIKVGAVTDITKLMALIRSCRAIRSDCAEGVDLECSSYRELWIYSFLNSDDEDRITMIQDVDILASDGDPVEELLGMIPENLISSREAKLIGLTKSGKHYA